MFLSATDRWSKQKSIRLEEVEPHNESDWANSKHRIRTYHLENTYFSKDVITIYQNWSD